MPKAYEANKKEVDNVLNSVQKQSKSYYKNYAEPYIQKIPRASTSTANTGSVSNNHTGDSVDSKLRNTQANLNSELNAAAGQFNQGVGQFNQGTQGAGQFNQGNQGAGQFNQGVNQGVKKLS